MIDKSLKWVLIIFRKNWTIFPTSFRSSPSEISPRILEHTYTIMSHINMQTAARAIRTIKAKNAIEKVLKNNSWNAMAGSASPPWSSEIRPIRADIFKSSQMQQAKDLNILKFLLFTLSKPNFLWQSLHSLSLRPFAFNILAIALTQSGKTSSMLSVIHNCVKFSTLRSTTALSSPDTVQTLDSADQRENA